MAVKMKYAVASLIMFFSMVSWAEEQKVYLLSKRQIVNSNHTLVVLFHDRAVTSIEDCQREIQRGYRDQWRFYLHKFPRPQGYSEKKDYLCIKAAMVADPWYKRATYDLIYQFDVRTSKPKIKKMANLAECLHDLRRELRDETRKFFCGKLSQTLVL